MEISVGTHGSARYSVEVRFSECPLIESLHFSRNLKSKPGNKKIHMNIIIREMKLHKPVDSHKDDESPPDSSLSASVSTDVHTATSVDVQSESDAESESEADVGVPASSVSHGTSDSSGSAGEHMPLECDIGKLQVSGVDIKGLSRDDRYRLLTTESNPDPLS